MKNKTLAIIPARSGSKGMVDKNISLLLNKPLLAYTIEAAIKSRIFDEIMVSTDSERYAEIARKYGAKVPFCRSKENSNDRASSWDVVREVVNNYHEIGKFFSVIVLLQPTSPLRDENEIIEAYKLYKSKNANTVISVCEVEHSPLWSNRLDDTLSMENFINKESIKPRQELSKFYRINGAIYIVDTETIINSKDIFDNSYAYVMSQEKSIDIDTELDFLFAEYLMKYKDKYEN